MSNVKELNINNTTYDIIGKGVVDQNNASTPLKQWSGTKAQYDAIATKDANTIYNITDDTNPNDYAHTNLDNVSAGIDYVIASQLPTSSNNYTWYRLYKSGWIEQGGQTKPTEYGSNGVSINLPIEMSDTNYQIMVTQITARRDGMGSTVIPAGYASSTTTAYICGRWVAANETSPLGWEVKGMSAQGGS